MNFRDIEIYQLVGESLLFPTRFQPTCYRYTEAAPLKLYSGGKGSAIEFMLKLELLIQF